MSEGMAWRRLAETGCESALREVMRDHLSLVYSVALRQTNHDSLLAQEVAQETFCLFARKASKLSSGTILSGWMYRTALHLARRAARAEQRRRVREREASYMSMADSGEGCGITWEEVAPEIDAALEELSEGDRTAVILRYFQEKPIRELSEEFGVSEDAAKMRVSRGLKRLREILLKRGLPVSAASLGAVLSAQNAMASVPNEVSQAIESFVVRMGTSRIGKARFSLRTNVAWIAATALVAIVSTGVVVLRREQRARSESSTAAMVASEQIKTTATEDRREAFDFEGAAAALRKALREPWTSRIPPVERIDEALAAFGKNRRLAAPVLMEMLLGARQEHTYEAQVLAVHGLVVLGPEAVETLDNLMMLHDSSDLHFLEEKEADLFAAVDISGISIPHFLQEIEKPNLGLPVTGAILARLLRNNPGVAPMYRERLMEMTNPSSEARVPATIIVAGVPSLYSPEIEPKLAALLQEAERLHWGEEIHTIPDWAWKRAWIEQAVEAAGVLKSSAAVASLEELARTESIPTKLRALVFTALTEIGPNSANAQADVASWRKSHEEGLRLEEKLERGGSSVAEVLAGLEHRESVSMAARRLSENKELVVQALPTLLRSIEMFDDVDARACVKFVPVTNLVQRLALHEPEGLQFIASCLMFETNVPPGTAQKLEEMVDYLDRADPKTVTVMNSISVALWQIGGREGRIPSPSDGFVYDFELRQLEPVLKMLSARDESWGKRLDAPLSYIEGKLIAQKRVCKKLLEDAFSDPGLRAAFLENERASMLLPFLALDLAASN